MVALTEAADARALPRADFTTRRESNNRWYLHCSGAWLTTTIGEIDARLRDVPPPNIVEATIDRFGSVDGLVNNAGQSRMSTYATTTDDA